MASNSNAGECFVLALPRPIHLARMHLEGALAGLKRAFDEAMGALPPSLRPHELHSNFHKIARQARLSLPKQLLRQHNFAAVIPGDSLAELVVTRGLSNFVSLYNTLLVVRILCTWFPEAPRAIVNPISTICDPYLNLFRGIIPPLGGTLDFSPILAFLLLDAFGNAATALPAELPADARPQNSTAAGTAAAAARPVAAEAAAAAENLSWRQQVQQLKRNSRS